MPRKAQEPKKTTKGKSVPSRKKSSSESTTEKKTVMGRPKKEIDSQQFETLCGMMCTLPEICAFFHATDKTVEKWCKETYGDTFSVIYKRFATNGTISLRRSQFKSAIEKGNVTMQIWLGKQYLGQSESLILSSNLDQDTIDLVEGFINESTDR